MTKSEEVKGPDEDDDGAGGRSDEDDDGAGGRSSNLTKMMTESEGDAREV
jgi:hypothetical protein